MTTTFDRQVMTLAAEMCRRDHPDLDFDLRLYKRVPGQVRRDAIGCEMRDDYIRRAALALLV